MCNAQQGHEGNLHQAHKHIFNEPPQQNPARIPRRMLVCLLHDVESKSVLISKSDCYNQITIFISLESAGQVGKTSLRAQSCIRHDDAACATAA